MATRNASTFEKRFKPLWRDDDREPLSVAEPLGPDHSHLWTLVDPSLDSGMQFWVPGYHYVNRVGYIFTEVPWGPDDEGDEYRRW